MQPTNREGFKVNTNLTAVKVEARNMRTVALNRISICERRKVTARQHLIAGPYSIPEYNAIVKACNSMIARANQDLRIANWMLTALRFATV